MFSFVLVLALSAIAVKTQTIGNETNLPMLPNCNCSINFPMNTTLPTNLLNSTSMQGDNINCNCTNFQGTTTLSPPARVTTVSPQGGSSSNQPVSSGGSSSSNKPVSSGGSSSTNAPAQGGSSTSPLLTLSPQVQQILRQFFPTLSSSAISILAANQSVKEIF